MYDHLDWDAIFSRGVPESEKAEWGSMETEQLDGLGG